MRRTASRQKAFTLTSGLGLAAGIVTIICLAIDHATANSVLSHITEMYSPYGTVPDPTVPWLVLYATFGAGTICWAVTMRGSARENKWTRVFGTAAFLVGGALLIFLFMVTEHGQAILPTSWRIVCLSTAIYGGVAMLVAWLPTTDRIQA